MIGEKFWGRTGGFRTGRPVIPGRDEIKDTPNSLLCKLLTVNKESRCCVSDVLYVQALMYELTGHRFPSEIICEVDSDVMKELEELIKLKRVYTIDFIPSNTSLNVI